jgi:NAD(P)-dependent dehydrogenase (short-subunit alcohol dehydrogenase family)
MGDRGGSGDLSGLDGKVALVTGGASGIGLATVERLSAEGAQVVVADIDSGGGKAAADKFGGRFAQLDVGDPLAWEAAVDETLSAFDGLDIAFLNAGIPTYPARREVTPGESVMQSFDIATLPDDAYRGILAVNVDGVVFGARAVVPAMERAGGGAIVATASVAGLIGFFPDPIYTLTKHAVVGLTRALAPTLAARKITFNCICPGVVDTNILGPDAGRLMSEHGIPIMQPSQIADAVVLAITGGATGEAFVCLPGRDHEKFVFKPIRGLGLEEGDLANLDKS